ncbi:hypothetical protein CBS101457_001679 [Exobasidium rhododendri]|nr:hypothetical protein CBS101457_001679 [Exobasidium rhododendri]
MEQIAIPDLDDDAIYDPNNDDYTFSSVQPIRSRPFRGAELNNHSRSGSAVSYGSSNGSRTGGGALLSNANRTFSSNRLNNASNHNVGPSSSSSAFVAKKGSFASLKAAIKGQQYGQPNLPYGTSTQEGYPPQLRNPFNAAGNSANLKQASTSDLNLQSHSRNESQISSTSRNRGVNVVNPAQTASYLKHNYNNSLHSDHSAGPNGGAASSLSESTGVSATGPSLPPLLPYPDAYPGHSAPPAKTAYARSLSNRTFPPNSSTDDIDLIRAPHPPFQYHDRSGSNQSSTDLHNASRLPTWMPDSMGGYAETDGPLLPPQPLYVDSWQNSRGSTGDSVITSEEGGRGSFDLLQRGSQTPMAESTTPRWKQEQQLQQQPGGPPMVIRPFFQAIDNSSQASLPSGVGLIEPVTPSEYAINVLCTRFITLAGVRIRGAMGGVDESDPSLHRILGSKVDPSLDALIDSLAHISRKNAKPVIDSLFQWRATLLEERVDMGEVRVALAGSQGGLSLGVKDIVNVLTRRKVLATAFLLCRALSQIASLFVSGSASDGRTAGLSDTHMNELQSGAFELMKDCSRERTVPSKMQAEAFEATTQLIGVLSKSCFIAVGDRFISFLTECQRGSTATSSKEGDPAVETAILAIRHLNITPYPMELFEEGAEFLQVISKHFAAAHGQRIKIAYAEALTQLMLPVAKSATAELHHPTWIKALDSIAPRAFAMLSKPRYWSAAYPLYVALLCVSPEDKFLQTSTGTTNKEGQSLGWSWYACLEAGVAKLNKDRAVRSIVLNAAVCLLWTYIFRCRESSTTTTKRLESFFRIWFPPNRTTIMPSDVTKPTSHIVLVHLVLYRHFEFGRDLVLDFMRHQALGGNTLSLQPELLSTKQRMTIAIRAILLTLDSYVKGDSPAFPANVDVDVERGDLGDELMDTFTFARPEIEVAQNQFNDLIGKIALLCDHQIGSITIFDEHQVTITRGTSITSAMAAHKSLGDEERFSWKIHHDARLVTAYSKDTQPTMDLLRACFDSWPRCLSSSIPFSSVLSALFKAHFSADPHLAESASACLQRIASQRKGGATAVVSGYMRSIFRQELFCWEQHPNQLVVLSKVEQSIKLWIESLNIWSKELKKNQSTNAGQKGWEMERTSAWAIIDEVEAFGLFLLCSAWRPLRRQAVGVLRVVARLDDTFVHPSATRKGDGDAAGKSATATLIEEEVESTRIIHLLDMPCSRFVEETNASKEEYADMTAWDKARTKKWKRRHLSKETLGDLAASEKSNELVTWFLVIPRFLRMCLDHFPTTVAVFRSFITTRVLWMDGAVSMAAGTSNRFNTAVTHSGGNNTMKGQSGSGINVTANANESLNAEQSLMAEHWKMYILALCTTTTSIEGQNRNRIANSGDGGPSSLGDRVIAAKDLFQKLIPFMASDHARFRDAVVSSLGNININLYKTLLETMQTVSTQLSEDFKTTRVGARRSRRHERLRTAVAHVIQSTSPHMAKVIKEQSVIFLILQWVKETFNFLTDREVRGDWEFHRLRRFFAGVVEEFFNSLHDNLSQDASERYLTFETKLRMFRLFREWHSFSQAAKDGPSKLANLLATVAEQYREDRNRENVLTLLRNETQLLSLHASSAMASLCQGVITLVGSAVPAPMSGSNLDTESLLEWLHYLFISPSPQNHAVARRALKALLLHNTSHEELIEKTTRYAFAESEQTTASRSFFAVFSEVLIEKIGRSVLPLQEILCLGLIKLGHPDSVMRKKAFALLSSVVTKHGDSDINVERRIPLPSLQAIEGGVSSPLPATYLRAQRDVSTFLAEMFPNLKVAMLCEYTLRLPSIDLIRRATTLGLLPEWLHQIELVEEGYDSSSVILPRSATLVLCNLLSLTIKYGDEHNFEIQDMWASMAEGPHYVLNASIVVKFLIQQALYLRSSLFITHAKRAVSCLSHTVLAPCLLSELCSYIEPSSMIPVPLELESMSLPDPALDHLYLANIEALLPPPSRKQTFSPGQVAVLFVGELTYEKSYLLIDKLPLLLHAIFINVDSVSPFTQEQVMAMFEQLLRSLSAEHGSGEVNSHVDQFFTKGTSIFWTHDDLDLDLDASHTPRMMRTTVLETLSVLFGIFPKLNEQWGNVALFWATSNPVRHMACRSFQAFRILLPKINYSMLADMLGRLSNTISDSIRIDNQTFALEILYTLKAIVKSIGPGSASSHMDILCHVFWMNVACLSTVNEAEFVQSIGLFHLLLDCGMDLNSADVVSLLQRKCPDGWEGEMGGVQALVMRGLKSSEASQNCVRLLARLIKIDNDQMIDHSDTRLGFFFLGLLPWFLQMTDEPSNNASKNSSKDHEDDDDEKGLVIGIAEDIAALASKKNKVDLQRVATSIAKNRFRTKDDLIRQAINCCIRGGFLPNYAKDTILLLMGLTFNSQEWLRKQTLQILKLFFQTVNTKGDDVFQLGSELLMPLLRLLNTNLSLPALEVLEESIVLRASSNGSDGTQNGEKSRAGPSAQQILRMSYQPVLRRGVSGNPRLNNSSNNNNNNNNNNNDVDDKLRGGQGGYGGPGSQQTAQQQQHHSRNKDSINEINSLFGQPEESGWSISDIQDCTTRTRINILSVFKSVELLLDTPPVGEVNFVDDYDADENVFEATMTVSRNDEGEEDDDDNDERRRRGGGDRGRGDDERSMPLTSNTAESASQQEQRQQEQQQQQQQQRQLQHQQVVQPIADLGDIVNQLHDLSSFFVDDDFSENDARTYSQSSGDLTNNHEQIARILGRSAMQPFEATNRQGSDWRDTVRNGDNDSRHLTNDGDESIVSSATSSNKRGGVWSRKSIFGGGTKG